MMVHSVKFDLRMEGAISDAEKPIFSQHHTCLSAEAGPVVKPNMGKKKKNKLIPASATCHSGIDALKNTLENTEPTSGPCTGLHCWLTWGPWEVRRHTCGRLVMMTLGERG